jgi:streptogramin lyase
VVAAGAVVALGAGAIALALTGDGGGSAADETGSTTDASTTSSSNTGTVVPGPVVPTLSLAPPISVPPFPDSLVYDGDEIWVTTVASGQLVRIDPSAASVTGTIDFGTETVDIAYDGTSLWVSLRAQQALVRVDPASGEVLDRFDFDRRTGNVAVGADAVWVTLHRPPGASEALVEGVARIDPSTREVREVAVPQPAGIFLTDDSLWVAQRQDNVVVQIDATTLESAGPTFPVGPAPDPVAVVDDVLWVGNRGTDTVSRIDLATGTTTTHQVDAAPGEILVDGDRVWVLCVDAGTLVLLTAGEGTRLLTQPVGTTTFSQILLDGDLWITVAGSNSVVRVDVS